MAIVTEIEDIQRATEVLCGILIGISIDKTLQDEEIMALHDWLNDYEALHGLEPFRSTALLIQRCLAGQTIDESEREEILEWCSQFDGGILLPGEMTTAVRRLNGVLKGIGIDGTVREDEVWGLNDWLQNYHAFRDHWPFSGALKLLERILEDGKVTADEKKELFDFCRRFSAKVPSGQPEAEDDVIGTPVPESLDDLCDRTARVVFKDKRFCFTGLSRTGSRKTLQDMVQALGAVPATDVIPTLDYLVLGADSSPGWAFSPYGLKIKKVLDYRRKGSAIALLHEDDLIAQMEQVRSRRHSTGQPARG